LGDNRHCAKHVADGLIKICGHRNNQISGSRKETSDRQSSDFRHSGLVRLIGAQVLDATDVDEMTRWQREIFELINEGHFRIVDPGPLHAPVRTFKIRRDDNLDLMLETKAPPDAKSAQRTYPAGTVRFNTDTVALENIAGIKAAMTGVIPTRYSTSHVNEPGQGELTEETKIHQIESVLRAEVEPAYIIDWVENLPSSQFVWPNLIKTKTDTTETATIELDGDDITIVDSESQNSMSRHAAKIVIGGVKGCICAFDKETKDSRIKPGCIIYVGNPDDAFRKKVRAAISFALGVYLVDLGSAVYCKEWQIISFKSRSAYSIDRKVFNLVVLPPAPLGSRWQHEINAIVFGRIMNAIFNKYDELNFAELSWAYWHALCATPHIAPVHFGAAIEMLVRCYMAAQPDLFPTKIINNKATWKEFSTEIDDVIAKLNIPINSKDALRENIGGLNRVHQRDTMNAVLNEIGIKLSADEENAWKRRNDAAHGMEMEPGEELALIRDIKLLKVIFHRMLLRITNGGDNYFDYANPGFPIRDLGTPVPPGNLSASP
jgi:hypothetical protein